MTERPIERPIALGGQAVVEGVMVRAPHVAAVVVRRRDGSTAARVQRLDGRAAAVRRVPIVRGALLLIETLLVGVGALTWSAAVRAADLEGSGRTPAPPRRGELTAALMVLAAAAAAFFLLPALAVLWLQQWLPRPAVVTLEAVLRLLLLLGYLRNIGRSEQARRVFQYHGAEHMAIQGHELGLPRTVAAIRRLDRAHPRCGTSFLLTVVIVAWPVFLLLGGGPAWWQVASRVVLIPLVAALAYEAIRLAGAHARSISVRWLFAANLALQRLTTRQPDDEQLQVALDALERCLEAEREVAPRRDTIVE